MFFGIVLTSMLLLMSFFTVFLIDSRIIKFLLCLSYLFGVYFVWNPQSTTAIANFFGVGRGIDFFVIICLMVVVNIIFFIARQIHSQGLMLTKLARSVAIMNARQVNSQ
jgi:hypothetical protein